MFYIFWALLFFLLDLQPLFLKDIHSAERIIKRPLLKRLCCLCLLLVPNLFYSGLSSRDAYLQGFGDGFLVEWVVNHSQSVILHHEEALFFGALCVDVWWPLNKEGVKVVHPETKDNTCPVKSHICPSRRWWPCKYETRLQPYHFLCMYSIFQFDFSSTKFTLDSIFGCNSSGKDGKSALLLPASHLHATCMLFL